MANPHKGEVSVELDGQTYTLALTLNAMVAVEELFGMSFVQVCEACERGSPKHIRAVMWAVLQKHHKALSIEDVGDMVDLGTMQGLSSVVGRVVNAGNPDPKDVPNGKANPTKARAVTNGIGASSTSRRAVSA